MNFEAFSTREVATAIWLTAFACWCLRDHAVRRSLLAVASTAFHWRLSSVFALLGLYTWVVVKALSAVHFWTPTQTKDTVLWFFFSGVALAFSGVDATDTQPLWKKLHSDQVKVVLLLEYLVGTYTFHIAIE